MKAYQGKKSKIFLDKKNNIFGFINGKTDNQVTIMHFDVDDLTSTRKIKSPYEISSIMFKLYSMMSEYFLKREGLAFFMGGDNFMVVSPQNSKKIGKNFINKTKKELGLSLNCGIGIGKTGRQAAKLATNSLDTIREIRDSGKKKPEIYEKSCF